MRDLPELELDLNAPEKFGNVAEKLDEDARRQLATDLIELVKVDETSMGPWLGKARGYLDRLDEQQSARADTSESEGADEEPPPSTEMVLSAVIQFSARAADAILGEPDLAKASEDDEGAQALAAWVSSQLRTKDTVWALDTDPLTVHMSVTGLAWRKRSFDDIDRVFRSHFLTCEEVIINKNVRSVERAPRITHRFQRYPYEIERSIQRGHWVDYGPVYLDNDPQAPKNFYECDLWLDLDGDGIAEPWTVAISLDDQAEVVRIRPRWSRKTIVNNDSMLVFNPIHRFYPYRFLPDPSGEFFPIGFGRLLDRTQSTADNLLASIADTAKSEGENGGVFSGGGFGMPDKVELKGNRLTSIPTDGAPLANRFAAFPAKAVSPGSVAVLEKILTLGDRLSGTLNLMQNAPASMTATLAKGIIDTGTQVQSAVHRRMVTSMTEEIRSFVRMADAYDMLPQDVQATTADGVAVTADPQLATEMQRSALAGIYMELLKDQLTNWKEVRMRLYRTLRLPQPEKLLGSPPASPEATPWEKMQGALGMMKQRTESIKVVGAVAQQLTQALKNMVDAGAGMVDQRAALLQVAQLEQAVQQMMVDNANIGNDVSGMAQQPGNQGAPGLPAPQAAGLDGPILGRGGAGGPADAGQGGGAA
jgi:hypothetical protein